jgi:phenol/toluene 2-monooxygenase (NADH) P0/A0
MHPNPDMPSRFVRVTSRAAGWVQFEFSIGDPDLCVELTMRPAQYEAFRRRERALELPDLPPAQLDQQRRHWHDSVPGAHPHD